MRYRVRREGRVALAFALMLVTATAACGSDDSAAGSSDELTYWSMWQEKEPQAQVIAQAIEAFEQDTGITVNVEWQGRDNITKLLAALRGGDVPDLIDQQYFTISNAIVGNDQFTPLGDVYDMEIPGEDLTVADALTDKYDMFTTTDDGERFLVPYEVIGYTVWYDATALPDVAANPPATWDDFTALLADAKAAGRSGIALDADIAGYAEYWTSTALVRALGPGGFNELVSDEEAAGWDTPEVREALTAIEQLAAGAHFIPGYDSSKFPAVQTQWAQGDADFLYMGSWAPTETGEFAAPEFEYRSFNFPTLGSDDSLPASVIGFAIPGPADGADAASEFIAYFLNKDRLSPISTDAANLTPRADIDVPPQLADVNELLQTKSLSKITDGVLGDHSDFDTKIFQPLNLELMTGRVTVDEFIEQITAQQRDYWENQG